MRLHQITTVLPAPCPVSILMTKSKLDFNLATMCSTMADKLAG